MMVNDDAADAEFFGTIPFMVDLGVEFVSMGGGEAELALTLSARHMNSLRMVHGGVTMALLDAVMSIAGRSLNPEARAGVTIEMKTSFMRPGGAVGARVVARGKALHHSLTLCFCEGEIWDGGKLVAKSSGTFKYMRRVDTARAPK
ncbi:MAG: PaaI family thioesterase [Pseudomonadota bacterium]